MKPVRHLAEQLAQLVRDAAPLVPAVVRASHRARLRAAHGLMIVAEAVAPEAVAATANHSETGKPTSHMPKTSTTTTTKD